MNTAEDRVDAPETTVLSQLVNSIGFSLAVMLSFAFWVIIIALPLHTVSPTEFLAKFLPIMFVIGCVLGIVVGVLLFLAKQMFCGRFPRTVALRDGEIHIQSPRQSDTTSLSKCVWWIGTNRQNLMATMLVEWQAVVVRTDPRKNIAIGQAPEVYEAARAILESSQAVRVRPPLAELWFCVFMLGGAALGKIMGWIGLTLAEQLINPSFFEGGAPVVCGFVGAMVGGRMTTRCVPCSQREAV